MGFWRESLLRAVFAKCLSFKKETTFGKAMFHQAGNKFTGQQLQGDKFQLLPSADVTFSSDTTPTECSWGLRNHHITTGISVLKSESSPS